MIYCVWNDAKGRYTISRDVFIMTISTPVNQNNHRPKKVNARSSQNVCHPFPFPGRNVALRQPTTQTSTYGNWFSSNVVNGKVGTVNGQDSVLQEECSHTNEGDSRDGVWSVIFKQPYIFSKIVIYNRRNPNRGKCYFFF